MCNKNFQRKKRGVGTGITVMSKAREKLLGGGCTQGPREKVLRNLKRAWLGDLVGKKKIRDAYLG